MACRWAGPAARLQGVVDQHRRAGRGAFCGFRRSGEQHGDSAASLDLAGGRLGHHAVHGRYSDSDPVQARMRRWRAGLGERSLEPEVGALARLAVEPDRPFEGERQAADDGQAQPRALDGVLKRGRAARKGFEDALAVGFRHARAGVLDAEAQPDAGLGAHAVRGQQDSARLGEFHGIAGEVEQNLTQPALVGQHNGKARIGRPGDFQTLGVGAGAEQLGDALQQGLDVGGGRVQVEPARIQLGQVEHIVDQTEQMLAGFLQGSQVGPLRRVQAGARQEARHAEHAIQGRAQLMAQGGQHLILAQLHRGAFPAHGPSLDRSA